MHLADCELCTLPEGQIHGINKEGSSTDLIYSSTWAQARFEETFGFVFRVLKWRLPRLKFFLGCMLFSLLWTGCNPSVWEKLKVCGVQKVMKSSLLGPLESREWETAGGSHMPSKWCLKLPSFLHWNIQYHHTYLTKKEENIKVRLNVQT